jgi:molecular chaperone GrpE
MAELEAKVAEVEATLAAANERLALADERLAVSDERLSQVTGERDTWQSKATALFDQYTRAKADFDGFRKRTERDFEDRLTRGKADYLRSVLDVLDNFDRFLAASGKSGPEAGDKSFDAFYKGVSMVHKQLVDTLVREGVEAIENPVGKQMDPAFHDAVAAQDGGGEHGTVIEEIQKGYVYKGLVLRPSRVRVAR